jgi:hypothetical protein
MESERKTTTSDSATSVTVCVLNFHLKVVLKNVNLYVDNNCNGFVKLDECALVLCGFDNEKTMVNLKVCVFFLHCHWVVLTLCA